MIVFEDFAEFGGAFGDECVGHDDERGGFENGEERFKGLGDVAVGGRRELREN